MAERTGFEPATPGVTGRYSNQLNYRSVLETEIWWVLQGSNLRPTACKAVALPTELNTRNVRKRALYSRPRRSQQAVLLTSALLITSNTVSFSHRVRRQLPASHFRGQNKKGQNNWPAASSLGIRSGYSGSASRYRYPARSRYRATRLAI